MGAADRTDDQGLAVFYAGLALPAALPHGTTRLDSWHMGNQPQRPPAALLPAHTCGEEEAFASPPGMVGAFRGAAAPEQGGECLIGKPSSAVSSLISLWRQRRGQT